MATGDNTIPNLDDPQYWGPRTAPLSLASLAAHPTAPAAAPPLVPMNAPPAVAGPQPGSVPSVMPAVAAPPAPVRPTPAASVAAGVAEHGGTAKAEGQRQFAEARPEVTAEPGTPEFFQQKAAQLEYDKGYPWGGDISAHPGIGGKIGHALGEIGNVAGGLLAPGLTSMVPGSKLNMDVREANALRSMGPATENQERAATTQTIKEGNEEIPHINLATGQPETITRKSLPMIEAAELGEKKGTDVAKIGATAKETVGAGHDQTATTIAAGKSKDQLLKLGYDEHGEPLPDEQLSTQQRATRDLTTSHTKLQQAQAALDLAKNDPNSPVYKAAQQTTALRMAEFQNKLEEQGLVKPSGQAASRGSAAQAALNLLPGLEDAVKANAKDMGPIIGRINAGEIKIGDVSPAVQKFYSQLQSFYALQPSVHGFRNAEFVKDFDTFVGNLNTNPDALIAGLEGLKPTLDSVKNEGVTYHQRIVEHAQNGGTGAPPETPTAGGGAVVPFAEFMKKKTQSSGTTPP
jgi:hypothetical protein